MRMLDTLNEQIEDTLVGRYFQLRERNSTFTNELRAGSVTFLTMAYILAVNSLILGFTGGTCTVNDCDEPDFPEGNCKFIDPGYATCVEEVKKNIVTATAASACISTFIMGAFANLPIALAPGLGVNAYFTYSVVGQFGSGSVSYSTALGAVFVEGWIFIILAITGARAKLIQLVPKSITQATSVGIGLFLAHIGLQASEGLALTVYDSSTLVTLGGCPKENQAFTYIIQNASDVCSLGPDNSIVTQLGRESSNHACLGGVMLSPSLWLGISGFALTAILMMRRVKGAIMIGILWVTIISWIPNHRASYLGAASAIPGGQERLSYFKKVVTVPNLDQTGLALSFRGFSDGSLWLALITFLYVDFLDCTGTLFSMATFLNQFIPGFIDEKKNFPGSTWAFCTDGIGIVVGSMMGTSPIAAYIESAAGIREGGRTGLTALTTCFYFFLAMFLTPIFSSIPPYAVGPALIIVGSLMITNVLRIRWERTIEALPAFLTIILMPLTYSIAYGVIAGLVSYIFLFSVNWLLDAVSRKLGWGPPQTTSMPSSVLTTGTSNNSSGDGGGRSMQLRKVDSSPGSRQVPPALRRDPSLTSRERGIPPAARRDPSFTGGREARGQGGSTRDENALERERRAKVMRQRAANGLVGLKSAPEASTHAHEVSLARSLSPPLPVDVPVNVSIHGGVVGRSPWEIDSRPQPVVPVVRTPPASASARPTQQNGISVTPTPPPARDDSSDDDWV